MRLVTTNPLQTFYDSLGSSPVKTIRVASPFITGPGVSSLIEVFKRKRTQIEILTNLSRFNIALSLSNPVRPLLDLTSALGKRVVIKSQSNLHAKLYLSDGRTALVGSSNLTYGGMQKNAELNWIIAGRRSEDKELLYQLGSWFNKAWNEAGAPLTLNDLNETLTTWERTTEPLRALLIDFIPEPRLGGDYWQKTREITRRKGWSIKAIETLLSESEDGSSKNSSRKLIFLKYLGLVDFDDRKVTILRKMTSQLEMYELLESGHLPVSLDAILRSFTRSNTDRMTYRSIAKALGVPDDGTLRGCVIWLESLGYIARHHTSSVVEFTIIKQGQNLVIS
ncbi:MAG: hypothetical protein FVQ79_08415 [Planctomycetes bacterium]|nr:hypothetical protein [Planctomycetota bacterium]